MNVNKFIGFLIFALYGGALPAQMPLADLSAGDWYKLAVEKNGVYRIDHAMLRSMGIDPSKVHPKDIRVFGNRGGMLPQSNSEMRPGGLIENAIFVSGEADGKFDVGDFILFYAEGPDRVEFNASSGTFYYESNLYTDKNYYFLTVGDQPGKRIATSGNEGDGFPVVTSYNDFIYHEVDEYNDQRSGREWFGEKFGVSTNEHVFTFSVDGIVPTGPMKLVSDVLGQSHSMASFQLAYNDVPIGQQDVVPIPNSRYGVKGIHQRDTFIIDPADTDAATRVDQRLKYRFVKGDGFSQAYLDFFLVSFERLLKLNGDQTIFLSSRSVGNAVSEFQIDGVSTSERIWDITDPYNILDQKFTIENSAARFATATAQLKKFVVFGNNIQAPMIIGKIPPQNLRNMGSPDLVIVTHPEFRDEALRLAAHRQSFDNLNVAVVTTLEVYNEFSSGRQDVSAIRDFMRHVFGSNPLSDKALLLFGKGSYDYKDRVPNNTNFVITYESRNSLHPLQTYSSDDYFGFLEDGEGEWRESGPAINHSLDIGVGRLPAKTVQEARNIVDKIIDYDLSKGALGYWRKQMVFVADDGNSEDGFDAIHQWQADQLATLTESSTVGIDANKLFMGSYAKTVKPNGEAVPEMTVDIVNAFDRGALVINYTGHGSEDQWTDENVFNTNAINGLDNKYYPFLVTATCEFGRNDDPSQISGAEYAVNAAYAGAMGILTSARDVSANSNFNFNYAFYEALFERDGNYFNRLGEVFRHAKNNSTSGVSNRNFSLLADPSATLALPPHIVHITELGTANGSDTLKALSTVTVRGEIRTFSGDKLTSFNGKVIATLFDKKTDVVTIGKNNPPFAYDQWDNALFRGQATVHNGVFTFTFMMPKNIAYTVAPGRLSLYAADSANHTDASGLMESFRVGDSESGVAPESNPPAIRLFIGDTTFVDGGIANPDTYLVANLVDDSGINISDYGIGNSILAVLDNDAEAFLLNDYFIANPDDPTSGWLRFPLKGLAPGRHTVTLTAWDVFNNASKRSIEFTVTDGRNIVIETLGNYPNPFRDRSTLFFTHNRSGDNLQARLLIQNAQGELIKSLDFTMPDSPYQVDLIDLDAGDFFGKKLPAGLYLARLIVRSLTNGSKYEQVTKLIILN